MLVPRKGFLMNTAVQVDEKACNDITFSQGAELSSHVLDARYIPGHEGKHVWAGGNGRKIISVPGGHCRSVGEL